MNLKSKMKRLISYILILSIFVGGLSFSLPERVFGSELKDTKYNPVEKNISFDFKLDATQRVTIEATVDDKPTDKNLIDDYELTGNSILVPHETCHSSYYYPRSVNPDKLNNVKIEEFEGGNDSGQPEKRIRITWDGRIDGIPLIGEDLDKDRFKLGIKIKPQGYPERNKPCEDKTDVHGNPVHIPGENWTWTQNKAFILEFTLLIDYKNRSADGSPTFLIVKGGMESELIRNLSEQFESGATIADLAKNFSCADLAKYGGDLLMSSEVMDPVGMVDGNFHFSYIDLKLDGGIPLTFLRTYNSRYKNGSMGKGFTHGYEYFITDDEGILRVNMPGGEEIRFLRVKGGGYRSLQNSGFVLSDTPGGYRMTHEEGSNFVFSIDGTLKEIINPAGVRIVSLIYDSEKKPVKIEGLSGSFDIVYVGKHISEVIDSAGRVSKYEYEGDFLSKVTNPDGDSLVYNYDENGYLSGIIDFDGNEYIKNIYDDKGRVLSQTFKEGNGEKKGIFLYDDVNRVNTYINGNGRKVKYHYDEHRNLVSIEDEEEGKAETEFKNDYPRSGKDREGNTTRHILDDKKRVAKIIYPDNSEISYTYAAGNKVSRITYADGYEEFTYDVMGNVKSHRDKNGHISKYTYNALGLMTGEEDPLGNITRYFYENTRMKAIEDPEGGKTSFDYDNVGRVIAKHVKISDEEEAVTRYEYSPAGKLVKITDALGGEINYEYSGNGFITKTIDPLGNVEEASYGGNGKIVYHKDKNGGETYYQYGSEEGELEAVTDPEGNVSTYSYYSDGKLKTQKDPEGNERSYEYNKNGDVIKETDPEGGKSLYTYDEMGRIKTITDEEGRTVTYEYDSLGRKIKEIDSQGHEVIFKYDPNGNLTETVDEEGNKTTSTYDKAGRQSSVTNKEGNTVKMTYDKVGRMTSRKDGLSNAMYYKYDKAGNLISETDENGNETKYKYDKLGNEIERINPDMTVSKKTYNIAGQIIESEDENGSKTLFKYDPNGNLIEETDPLGNITKYAYTKNNKLKTVKARDGATSEYHYNKNGQVTKFTDPGGYSSLFTYDPLLRLKTSIDPTGIVNEYFYDRVGNMLRSTRNGIVREENEYDSLDRLISKRDAAGNKELYFYDKVGNIIKYKDKEGNTTKYTYNKEYQLISEEDALGNRIYNYYDITGRKIKEVDEKGNETSYKYDRVGNVIEVKDPMSSVTKAYYDSRNRLISKEDELGNITTYIYDKTGSILKEQDPLGGAVTYEYDLNGNLKIVKNKNNEKTFYAYDSMDRLIKVTNRLNHSRIYEYDLSGNKIAYIDANKNKTCFTYDSLGRLLERISPEGSFTRYKYDDMGNISEMILPGGNGNEAITRYKYDEEGNVLQIQSPLGYISGFTYDKEGNILTATNEEGITSRYVYDKIYRNTEIEYPDNHIYYTYDPVGNMLTAKDKEGVLTFTYDALSRTETVTNEKGKVTSYEYDKAGNRIALTYPDGKKIKYAYDVIGNLAEIKDHDGKVVKYTRDLEGKLIKTLYHDGSTTELDYNGVGLLTQQKEVDKNGKTRRESIFAYDDEGNLRFKQKTGIGINKTEQTVKYTYDRQNRLIKTVRDDKQRSYTYDKAGNMLTDGKNTYTYDIQNRIKTKVNQQGTTNYLHDRTGNLIQTTNGQSIVKLTYNNAGNLVKAQNQKGEITIYTYNALGARTKNVQVRKNKNVSHQNGNLKDGSRGEDYLHYLKDGRNTWQRTYKSEVGTIHQNDFETVTKNYQIDYLSPYNRDIIVTENGTFTNRYIYDDNGTGISCEIDYAEETRTGEAGENPASDIASQSIKKLWYRGDIAGSNLFTVNETGDILSHVEYDEWGAPQLETYTDMNYTGIENLNNYTGYSYDEVLKSYYAQNRFYDPFDHRFMQEDDMQDGDNWYNYCENNPINYIDPSGNISYTTQLDDFLAGAKSKVKQAISGLDPIKSVMSTIRGVLAIGRAIKNGSLSMKNLAKTFGKGVVDAMVGDIVYVVKHFDHFNCKKKITNKQARELGQRTVGAAFQAATLSVAAAKLGKAAPAGLNSLKNVVKATPNKQNVNKILNKAKGQKKKTAASKAKVKPIKGKATSTKGKVKTVPKAKTILKKQTAKQESPHNWNTFRTANKGKYTREQLSSEWQKYKTKHGIEKKAKISSSGNELKERKRKILKQNVERGKAYEKEQFEIFKNKYKEATEQITIVIKETKTKTRLDAIGFDDDGKIVINEFKSSRDAPLTDKQKEAFEVIAEKGGIVVGKGKPPFTKGFEIPIDVIIEVIRPD